MTSLVDAWIARPSGAVIARLDIEDDRPVVLGLTPGPVSRAIGGLDMHLPETVVALRVICDGAMTYAAGRLRLDMATWAILLVGTSADRQELDDRLCDLAVELVRPGGYDELRRGSGRSRPGPAVRAIAER
jgi:hypothetical protein